MFYLSFFVVVVDEKIFTIYQSALLAMVVLWFEVVCA